MIITKNTTNKGNSFALGEENIFMLEKAIDFLLSVDSKGLFLVRADEEKITISNLWLEAGNEYLMNLDICPYAVANVALTHLEKLNGSLLTSSLYPYFMTMAESRNFESQLYVMRILLNSLPVRNYRILKRMAFLLFKQSLFSNDWACVLKLGSLIGPLFVNRERHFNVFHRWLTIEEAATRLIIFLVKQWKSLFENDQSFCPASTGHRLFHGIKNNKPRYPLHRGDKSSADLFMWQNRFVQMRLKCQHYQKIFKTSNPCHKKIQRSAKYQQQEVFEKSSDSEHSRSLKSSILTSPYTSNQSSAQDVMKVKLKKDKKSIPCSDTKYSLKHDISYADDCRYHFSGSKYQNEKCRKHVRMGPKRGSCWKSLRVKKTLRQKVRETELFLGEKQVSDGTSTSKGSSDNRTVSTEAKGDITLANLPGQWIVDDCNIRDNLVAPCELPWQKTLEKTPCALPPASAPALLPPPLPLPLPLPPPSPPQSKPPTPPSPPQSKPPPPPPPPPQAKPPPPPRSKPNKDATLSIKPPDNDLEGDLSGAKKPRMKQLSWSKITGPLTQRTVWKNAAADSVNKSLDLTQLESLFSASTTKTNAEVDKMISVKKRHQRIHIIDAKRAHNISIQLSSLRRPFADLCKALHEIDEKILTNEALHVLLRTIPAKEDISLLKEYKGDPLQLAEVEKYYLEIMLIPRVEKRIQVLNFRSQCKNSINQIKQELLLLQNGCDELKGSKNFVKLLETVLVVGNYLNGDTSRGDAKGFKLDALLKLADVKGSNRQMTLLHFVVIELLKVDGQSLNLRDELKTIKIAANIKLESTITSIAELDMGLELTKQEIEFARDDLTDTSVFQQRFLDMLIPFYEQCSTDVVQLKELRNSSLAKLKDVCEYFGENGDEQPQRQLDLFKTIQQFLNMFDHVSKDIQRMHHKFEYKNDIGHPFSNVQDRNGKEFRDSGPQKVMESSENRIKTNNTNVKMLDLGNGKENQNPESPWKEMFREATIKTMIPESPRKFDASDPVVCLGYDSDWSTC